MRDARITTIYEGTSGIQANDFIGRKVLRDNGTELHRLISEIKMTLNLLAETEGFAGVGTDLGSQVDSLEKLTHWLVDEHKDDQYLSASVAFNYLMGAGTCIAGWLLAKSALVAADKMQADPEFYEAKITTCRFYTAHVLPRAAAYFSTVKTAIDTSLMLEDEAF